MASALRCRDGRARRADRHRGRRQRHRHACRRSPPARPRCRRWSSCSTDPRSATTTATTWWSRFDHLCVACHGFSALATARAGDRSATVLFDVGPYGDVWLANAERLAVDLATIDVLFVSHWHWDHTGAIPTVVAAVTEARTAAGLPPLLVDVHPDRPDQRGMLTALGKFAMLPEEPTFAAIEAAGGQIVRHADAHAVGGGLFLASGDIPRHDELRDRAAGAPHLARRPGRLGPGDPRRALPRGPRPRPGHHGLLRLLPRGHRQRRPRGAAAPPGHAGRPAAGWLPPRRAPASSPASTRPSRTSPTSSSRGSWRPVTAPAGARRPPSRTPSGRPATRRAWWGPGTCSLPRPDARGQE